MSNIDHIKVGSSTYDVYDAGATHIIEANVLPTTGIDSKAIYKIPQNLVQQRTFTINTSAAVPTRSTMYALANTFGVGMNEEFIFAEGNVKVNSSATVAQGFLELWNWDDATAPILGLRQGDDGWWWLNDPDTETWEPEASTFSPIIISYMVSAPCGFPQLTSAQMTAMNNLGITITDTNTVVGYNYYIYSSAGWEIISEEAYYVYYNGVLDSSSYAFPGVNYQKISAYFALNKPVYLIADNGTARYVLGNAYSDGDGMPRYTFLSTRLQMLGEQYIYDEEVIMYYEYEFSCYEIYKNGIRSVRTYPPVSTTAPSYPADSNYLIPVHLSSTPATFKTGYIYYIDE